MPSPTPSAAFFLSVPALRPMAMASETFEQRTVLYAKNPKFNKEGTFESWYESPIDFPGRWVPAGDHPDVHGEPAGQGPFHAQWGRSRKLSVSWWVGVGGQSPPT